MPTWIERDDWSNVSFLHATPAQLLSLCTLSGATRLLVKQAEDNKNKSVPKSNKTSKCNAQTAIQVKTQR